MTRTCVIDFKGTPSYIPPEMLMPRKRSPDEKCDVYSFGIICSEIFTETRAFGNNRGTSICCIIVYMCISSFLCIVV